jgi:hypothetical protein
MKRAHLTSTLLVAVAFVLMTARLASAQSVTLAWDANTEADLAGYIVHYGEQSGSYTKQVDVKKTTTATISSLTAGRTYYFAVQAYSTAGLKSPLSTPVQATIPTVSQPPPPPPPPPTSTPLLPPAQFVTLPGADGRLTSRTLQWTSVADAQAYYLYVGTTSGAKDVVDTGEFQATSYKLIGTVPTDRIFFARIWTKQAEKWRFSEINFMMPAPPGPAKLISPVAGEQNVTSAQMFVWTEVPGAEAYYLYVGSQQGAKDVVDTGEVQQLSYTAKALPAGQRLYARIHTKVSGSWYASEVYFDSAPASLLRYPTHGEGNVSQSELFQWSAVQNAAAYYLQVGTAPGAKNVVDTGEIQATSHLVSGLAPGRTYYTRLWTKLGTGWVFDDVAFTTSRTARLLRPNGIGGDLGQGFAWTSILGAQAYYLYLGTQPGAKNLIDSGETLELEYPAPPLPAGRELYSRMHTKLAGLWRARDLSFYLSGASLIQPLRGAVVSYTSQLFSWTPIANAEVYYLYIGSMPGAKDIVDTGEIKTTSYNALGLPRNRTLFVTLWTRTAQGGWRNTESVVYTR